MVTMATSEVVIEGEEDFLRLVENTFWATQLWPIMDRDEQVCGLGPASLACRCSKSWQPHL